MRRYISLLPMRCVSKDNQIFTNLEEICLRSALEAPFGKLFIASALDD